LLHLFVEASQQALEVLVVRSYYISHAASSSFSKTPQSSLPTTF
jgi:hypothetical protein